VIADPALGRLVDVEALLVLLFLGVTAHRATTIPQAIADLLEAIQATSHLLGILIVDQDSRQVKAQFKNEPESLALLDSIQKQARQELDRARFQQIQFESVDSGEIRVRIACEGLFEKHKPQLSPQLEVFIDRLGFLLSQSGMHVRIVGHADPDEVEVNPQGKKGPFPPGCSHFSGPFKSLSDGLHEFPHFLQATSRSVRARTTNL
jgi:hypothetical protein